MSNTTDPLPKPFENSPSGEGLVSSALFADWVEIPWAECNVCGQSPTLAKEAEDLKVWDGTPFHCSDCGAEGYASVSEGGCYVWWKGWDY